MIEIRKEKIDNHDEIQMVNDRRVLLVCDKCLNRDSQDLWIIRI